MYFLYHVECKRNECLFCNDLRWDRNLKICCPVWIECTEKKLSDRGGWSFKNSIFSNAILHIPKILICKTKSIPRHHGTGGALGQVPHLIQDLHLYFHYVNVKQCWLCHTFEKNYHFVFLPWCLLSISLPKDQERKIDVIFTKLKSPAYQNSQGLTDWNSHLLVLIYRIPYRI